MKVYTRTGDKGQSSLFTGERRPKDDLIFEALGSVDELTSYLGLVRDQLQATPLSPGLPEIPLTDQLYQVQCLLQDLNSNVATPRSMSSEMKRERTHFDPTGEATQTLERWIDQMDEQLEPLKTFILPSGGLVASQLHVSRSICRRAERRVVPLVREALADASTQMYLNRLSDYLFTAARLACRQAGVKEEIYRKPQQST